MTTTQYDIGDVAVLRGVFTTSAGAAVDPTAVRVFVKAPDGTETIYTYGVDLGVIKDSTGAYHFNLALTEKGSWFYRWVGTGAAVAAGESHLKVNQSRFSTPV